MYVSDFRQVMIIALPFGRMGNYGNQSEVDEMELSKEHSKARNGTKSRKKLWQTSMEMTTKVHWDYIKYDFRQLLDC